MKILFCHTYYQQTGGEDLSFDDEVALLTANGHSVETYLRHNDDVRKYTQLRVAAESFWSQRTYREVCQIIRRSRPDVVHCTNTFPLMSPSVYYAARRCGVPVVQSLRNYRIMCANGLFFREGKVCEKCLRRPIPWPAIRHKCYRNSTLGSGAVAAMVGTHWKIGTWTRAVDLYTTLTHIAKSKFVAAGLPEDRIRVKPNFLLNDPGMGSGDGRYALFAGRLSQEKGVDTMLEAWAHGEPALPLRIVGDGPMAEQVRAAAAQHPRRIQWLGPQSRQQVDEHIGAATCVLVPSLWYETFGRTIMEAFACGVPVIASRLGAMEELVEHGRTGLHFEAGDAAALTCHIQHLANNPQQHQQMRHAARQTFTQRFTAETNYGELIALYKEAVARRGQARARLG